MADSYDATFTHSKVGRALREIVWSRFLQLFRSSHYILELGCGTGEDAVRLAGSGAKVLATDPSSRMIHAARRKGLAADCQDRIEFRCAAMQEVASFADRAVFDGVLSNFGAVNCVQDLPALVADVAERLAPGAPLLWVIMGRHAPWEWFWYLSRGQWSKAFRRLRAGGLTWRDMRISYPTPAEVRSVLQPHFKVTRMAPLGVALPPNYAAAWLDHSPFALRLLVRLEWWAQRSSRLANWSDHFIVEAVRRFP